MTEMRWMEIEEEEGRWGSDEVKEEDEDGGREGVKVLQEEEEVWWRQKGTRGRRWLTRPCFYVPHALVNSRTLSHSWFVCFH